MPKLFGFNVSNASYHSYFNFVDNLCTLTILLTAIYFYDKQEIQPYEEKDLEKDHIWSLAVIIDNLVIFLLVIFASIFIQIKGFQKKFRVLRLSIELPSLAGLYYFYIKYKIIEERFPKDGMVDKALGILGQIFKDVE